MLQYLLTSERRRLRAPTSAGTQLAIVMLNKQQYVIGILMKIRLTPL